MLRTRRKMSKRRLGLLVAVFTVSLLTPSCAPAPKRALPGVYRSHSKILDEALWLNKDGSYNQELRYANGINLSRAGRWEFSEQTLQVKDAWDSHYTAADVDCEGLFPPRRDDPNYFPTYFLTGLELERCPDADSHRNLNKTDK
jgi:hypothetical protein